MKRLSLKSLSLNDSEILQNVELKTILGGGPPDQPISPRCDGNFPDCAEGTICCGPPGGAQYCQACPCGHKCD